MATRDMHHARRRRLRGFGYFRGLGPGLVTGAADDDPAGIGTYSQIGASLRFDMLWTVPLSLPLAAAVIELAARLGLVTDRGLAGVVRARFPRAVVYPILGLVIAANTFNVGADLGAMAAAARLLVPVPQFIGVVGFALLIAVLQVRIPYDKYARILRWLVLSLGAYLGVLVTVNVPWGEVLTQMFVPRIEINRAVLAAAIAIFGTTISPYLFFWQAAEELEENHEGKHPIGRRQMRAMRLDVLLGVAAGVMVMFAIMTATGATLGKHPTNITTADQAARALEPLAGPLASLLFTVGILGTGLLAIPTLAGSSAYALAESFHWQEGLSRRLREAPGFYLAIIGGIALGVVQNLVGINPMRALFLSAILNGLAAPPIMLLMMVAGRSDDLGAWRSRGISLSLVAVAAAVMTILPVWYVVTA